MPKTAAKPAPKARVYVPAADVNVSSDWAASPYARTRLDHHARVAALVMVVITLCFPLAACVSQL